jgi:hypothetical protein|tara:strand:+ start:16452 stop:16640 length:189 start_codon:yes stop_codon:yes gene_type:complete
MTSWITVKKKNGKKKFIYLPFRRQELERCSIEELKDLTNHKRQGLKYALINFLVGEETDAIH